MTLSLMGSLEVSQVKEVKVPIYQLECQDCKQVEEVLREVKDRHKELRCPKCGGKRELIMTRCSVQVFDPFTSEHAEGDPITFQTKREMRRYERDHGVEFSHLL